MTAKVEHYIAETCKMQHSFTCIFTNKVCCANRIFRSASKIYCSFCSESDSCGSDEGSLQPSLWLPKLSSILQKLAKCSTALHGPLGVAPIEFFVEFLQYTTLSTQPATHVAVMREAYGHHYGYKVAETAKCSTTLNPPLGVASIELFTQFPQYTSFSTQPANHVAVMREASSHHYGSQR